MAIFRQVAKIVLVVLLTAFFIAYLGYRELGRSGFWAITIGFGLASFNFLLATLFGVQGIKKQSTGSLTAAILSGILIRFPIVLGILYYASKLKWINFLICAISFTVFFTILLMVEVKVLYHYAKLKEI